MNRVWIDTSFTQHKTTTPTTTTATNAREMIETSNDQERPRTTICGTKSSMDGGPRDALLFRLHLQGLTVPLGKSVDDTAHVQFDMVDIKQRFVIFSRFLMLICFRVHPYCQTNRNLPLPQNDIQHT